MLVAPSMTWFAVRIEPSWLTMTPEPRLPLPVASFVWMKTREGRIAW
jgi:hypothetical protein